MKIWHCNEMTDEQQAYGAWVDRLDYDVALSRIATLEANATCAEYLWKQREDLAYQDRDAALARIAVLTEALEYYASNYSADSLIGFRAKEALATAVKGAE